MNEVITGIRAIKMYAWEYAFRDVVTRLRKQEVTQILKYMVLRATGLAFTDVAATPLVVFVIVALTVLTGGKLSLYLAVFIISMSRLVADNSCYYAIRALTFLFDANTSVKRIQRFLELEELDSCSTTSHTSESLASSPYQTLSIMSATSSPAASHPLVRLDGVTFSWSGGRGQNTVSGVSFSLTHEPLLAIVGPVGAGKGSTRASTRHIKENVSQACVCVHSLKKKEVWETRVKVTTLYSVL
jgi:ATP-binding cassette subfamily C (CFTR/MRP) protein 4